MVSHIRQQETMSNDDSTLRSTNCTIPVYSCNGTNAVWITNSFQLFFTDSPPEQYSRYTLNSAPQEGTVIAIMSLSALVFVCSCLVLLATYCTGGGGSATFVFLRSLCLSDILMSIYGMSKMTMLLCLDRLNINFFLPEGLFFTASLASTMSLLFLNTDYFMKLTRPLQYTQVDKDTVITVMLFMWNAAFIVGFLPLIGWNQEKNTVHFFSFYPWHYLFLNGLINFICVAVCIGCMVSLKRSHTLSRFQFDCFSTRKMEVRNYKHLYRTVIVNSVMWLCCYIPFFLYIALTCPQCLLGDFPYRDSAIIYFIPIFMMKSLLSSVLQAFRATNVLTFVNKLLTATSIMADLRQRRRLRRRKPKEAGISAISYTNPLCDHHNIRSNNHIMLDHNHFTLHHSNSEAEYTELINESDFDSSFNGSSTSIASFNNYFFRSPLDSRQTVDRASQETTAL